MKIRADKLEGVSETLFYPLYMRYLEARKDNGIISDHRYREIVEAIDLESFELDKIPRESQMVITQRTMIIDSLTRDYIDQNPDGLIVNLGAGLDLRFEQVDNRRIQWIDIDLPAVIELRKRFIKETKRSRFLAASVIDPLWIDDIPKKESVLFIAEGLLPYLKAEEVRELLSAISDNFIDSEMIFDAITSYILYQAKKNKDPNYMGQKISELLIWPLDYFGELESWDLGIGLRSEHYPVSVLEGLMEEAFKDLQSSLMDDDEFDLGFDIDENIIAGIIHNFIVGSPVYHIALSTPSSKTASILTQLSLTKPPNRLVKTRLKRDTRCSKTPID
jgi:O-methyltransferase involved in polyketide biosynthesis